MSRNFACILRIVILGSCLLGLAGAGALAGSLHMGSNPSVATANSIWNINATWQDENGDAPVLDKATITEPMMDYGLSVDGWGPTIGTPRLAVPLEWTDGLQWWPNVPAPDGFIGFPVPFDANGNDLSLPWEQYEEVGYASLQPDPVDVPMETSGDAGFDHGVDVIVDEVIPMNGDGRQEVGWPEADGTLPDPIAGRAATAITRDDTKSPVVRARPETPAFIQTSRVPVLLIGVWSDSAHLKPIKARLSNAASLKLIDLADPPYPPDPVTLNENPTPSWPKYSVIEVLEDDKKVAGIVNYYVSYYAAGNTYAVTQQGPLPMPYTVYKIPVTAGADGVPYLPINDGILTLDPGRTGDLNDPSLLPENSPVLGIYGSQNLSESGLNYFDLTAANQPLLRYEAPDAPGSMHPTFGKLFFCYDPSTAPAPNATPGTSYYVVVSTNAVDGVFTTPAGGDADNLYVNPDPTAVPRVFGYCAKAGVIALAVPAADPIMESVGTDNSVTPPGVEHFTQLQGQKLYLKYRKLSNTTVTVGRTANVGLVDHLTGLAPANAAFVTAFTSIDAQPDVPRGKFIIDTKTLPTGTFAVGVNYWPIFPMVNSSGSLDPMGVVWYKGSTPMHYRKDSIVDGATYGVSVSAGLKMYNREQWPDDDVTLNQSTLNNKLIYDDIGWPMYYDSALTGSELPPTTHLLTSVGYGVKARKLVTYSVKPTDNVTVVTHSGATALACYSDSAYMPSSPGVDPLAVEAQPEDINASTPDDGSSSSQFVFRIDYVRKDRIGVLPPLPWLRPYADPWSYGYSSGVVLYLDKNGTGDYKPHFMQADYETKGLGVNSYIYRVMPHNMLSLMGGDGWAPWPHNESFAYDDNDLYQSLQMGVYHYFFGTTSDSVRFTNTLGNLESFAFEHQNPSPMDPNDPTSLSGLDEWGETCQYPYFSTGLDPYTPRAVTGYPLVDRAAGRRYSADNGATLGDTTLYVHRTDRAPGLFEGTYKYPYVSSVHPRVSCELHMPSVDDFQKRYDAPDYGEGRFFGTLFPFRSALNPAHAGVRGGGMTQTLAETSGSYSTDANLFRILYKQIDNKAPIEIKLWVNDANEKTGTDTAHTYRSYTMNRRADQINPNYINGVWYEATLQSGSAQLPYGAHTYYFTAYDGEQHARWPVRPDYYSYSWPGPDPTARVMNPTDAWVPSLSFSYDRLKTGYFDNDYAPGPYVNHAPKVTNVSVTPSAGKEGTPFVFKATYSDADGQRPYSTDIIIQLSDGAQPRRFAMRPDPSYNIDPSADNSALYKSGVNYILDTATVGDLALQKGVRKFYIEFTDDWGREDSVNDRRIGEMTTYPSVGNWVQGPVISGNTPPTLSNARVQSMDNTSNSATVWSFNVNYRDIDRDAPALIKVFIGRLQPQDITTPTPSSKVHTIIWDSGHTMLPSTADTVYSHGVDFFYKTRLAGPETVAPQMVTKQLTISSASNQINPDPSKSGDIIRVWKVYTSANPNTNYYSYTGSTPPDYVGGMITLNATIPAGDVWIQYERRPAVQYYYAFEAFDGVDYATYKSSADANVRSDAAGCFILQNAVSQDSPVNLHYKIRPEVVKPLTLTVGTSSIDPDPQKIGDIVRIWGVYTNEDLTGVNYYPLPSGQTAPVAYDNATHPTITLTQALLAGRIWLLVEADTPLVGPMPIQQPAPAGVIPDPEVFVNFTQSGIQQLITDQKNGFIDELNGNVDRAIVFMGGQASFDARPSKEYAAPDVPSDIASVEGVYWLSNPDISHQYDNYYEPSKLVPPIVRAGTLAAIPLYVQLADPEEVYKVLGVYDNSSLTRTNYYTGDPTMLKWQPASTISNNVIWPSRPNDIASIQGVFLSMNVNDAAGNFWTPETGTPSSTFVVPATVNLATGVVTISPAYNYGGAIKAIVKINQSADMSGQDYYTPVNPLGDLYNPAAPPVASPVPAAATVYVSYVPAEGFGPDHEFMALRKALPTPRASTVYIAYYPPGDLDSLGLVDLAVAPPPATPMFVKIWAKGFNPGDQYIKLTTPLPDVSVTGTVVNSGLVRPDPNKLADIGSVTGVFVELDPVNYYVGTANPFKIGDTDIHLAQALPVLQPNAEITIKYLPRERDITIKYSDMRFTHTFSGYAEQIYRFSYNNVTNKMNWVTMIPGSTHFVPDGITSNSVNITGNAPVPTLDPLVDLIRDIDAGIVGIWQYPEFTGPNFFNPRRTALYEDNPSLVRLSTEAPAGTDRLYARAYEKGVYFLDRWNRDLRFDSSKVLTDLDRVQVSYFFGSRMTQVLVPNTLPSLSRGMVAPLYGPRSKQFVYSVWYTDGDGPTGQMPTYVRVYIDGVAHDMTPANQGTPDYKAGAQFTFTPIGGLSGRPHTFYFEASDGAAVAWFDKLGAHNSDRSSPVEDIVELDGPWVNDPPSLINGLVSPNPTGPGAGIGTTDSVDYRVTLIDVDNDPPYTFDPLRDIIDPLQHPNGIDVSGSPRVWIDAGLSDDTKVPVVYTIVGLEADPSEITKLRVIKATKADGTDPNWTTDQFAGQLMQISNGNTWIDISPSPYTSVYLIQSNTANKLLIAIDDLVNDKLIVPVDPTTGAPRFAQFRVNGLLMTKTDPNQVDDWAVGVDYKITVPRLQVGSHDFHFTARTREDKPDWLLALFNTPGNTGDTSPFSEMVRFPSLGDSTGPNVISKPDQNNSAPVLTPLPMSPSRTLYRGPQAQAATVTSPSTAQPTEALKLLTILGVYRNANFDAHLDPNAVLPADQPKDFFDPASMVSNPPAPGSGDPVKMTPNLYPVPNTMVLVQRSSRVENATTVVPDVPSAIATVLAVYLRSDPTLQNPYSVAASTLGVDNKIRLNSPGLPAGTTDVFFTYRPKTASMTLTADGSGTLGLSSPNSIAYVMGVYRASDAGKTTNLINSAWVPGNASVTYTTGNVPTSGTSVVVDYVPWPPVYLKYYAVEPVEPPSSSPRGSPLLHGTFVAGEPLTFAIFYKDADGDRPTYHDGVQGYVKLFFNDLPGRTAQLSALAPPASYITGVPYGVTLTDVPPGRHTYHFEASDGYVVTRYPIDQTGNAALDEKVQVNNKPVLSNGSVDHASGATTFTFSVTYQDSDNVAPPVNGVKVTLTNRADPTKTAFEYLDPAASPNYFTGVRFSHVLDVIAHGLPVGTYDAVFTANDGIQDADPLGGTSIEVRPPDPNHHPFITDYAVYKLIMPGATLGSGVGKTTDTFVYRARYKDSYDDAPVATFGGVRQTALSLIIDGDTAHPLPMTMVPMTGTPDYTGVDGAHWPWWEARVTGKSLKGGNHNYTVAASDGTVAAVFDTGVPSIKYGPILMIPYFALQVKGKDGSTITGQAIVGQEVLVTGQMYFPYIATQADLKPIDLTNLVIQVTKPDGTVISLNGSLTVRPYDALNNPDNWVGDITVQYSGYVDPALATGSSLTLVASGQWIIDASWVGDATYDGAKTDSVFDSHNDQVRVTVSGPSRTVATADPLRPETATPLVDMITPPMMIGSSSPSSIFGPDRALTMQIVKWSPSVGQYYRYDVGGYFPPLRPGDAVWIKPKVSTGAPGTGYPAAEAITRAAVEEGWTTLDNPLVENADVGGSPRYLLNSYRLIKVLAQAYPLKTDTAGTVLLDSSTGLPLFKPCTIPMNTGWNQFGNIFFNWKRMWQVGSVEDAVPPPPFGGVTDYGQVRPSGDPLLISRVLGVFTTSTPTASDTNYFQPGSAQQPFARGDATIHLTNYLPAGVTSVYIKYEAYPKEDVGIPISEVHVSYLGVRKTLADAKTAGWITDYAWRYDTIVHDYVPVSDTRVGAERVLKAWSGYWVRAFVNCDFEIDPNTAFNGVFTTTQAFSGLTSFSAATAAGQDMIAPPPAPKD